MKPIEERQTFVMPTTLESVTNMTSQTQDPKKRQELLDSFELRRIENQIWLVVPIPKVKPYV